MSCPFNAEQLSQLKAFVQMCEKMPQILHHPSLSFFKDFIITLGGTIPVATFKPEPASEQSSKPENKPDTEMTSEDSEPESEVELDMEGVIEGDVVDDNQIMGDSNKSPTDEEVEQADEKRSAAMRHFGEQQYEEALKMYSEAIDLNPTSALLFAKRGQVYLKLNKPNACIKDCTHALELNCDSAASYKFRGRAHRLLGHFDKAAADLRESCKIDFDEQAQEWLAEVTPNAEKIRAHELNVQRRKEEKEHREKLKRYQKAKEAHATASATKEPPKPNAGGAAGNFGDAAFNMADQMGLFNDPEIIAAFQDPEVAAAFKDASSNPANIFKYQNNPKINNIIKKLSSKMGGAGGFPGFTPPPPSGDASAQFGNPSNDDVGLD